MIMRTRERFLQVATSVNPRLYPHSSDVFADACAAPSRVACVRVVIDCEEGEGLEERGGPTRTETTA